MVAKKVINKNMAKIYKCTACIEVTVEAEDEYDVAFEAGMHLDIGDTDWDFEEVKEVEPNSQSLTNVTIN